MSGLDTLRTRLDYRGGNAEGRFQQDKLESLRKALLYSYQAETAVIDGKMFRCLLNTNKQKADYDCKILSIPYEDICLGEYDEENDEIVKSEPDNKTKQSKISTGIDTGKIFLWKETNTHWIVYLKYLEEDAYFRGEVYKCEEEPVEINGHKYYVYIRGPVETTIQWNQKNGVSWNDLNYSLIMYITKNEETLDYFHRFSKIKVGNEMWEVKTVDPYSADEIIEICLGETYNNEYAEAPVEEATEPDESGYEQAFPHISGPASVQPFDIVEYSIEGLQDGDWIISNNKKARFVNREDNVITIEIITGKSGNFDLTYKSEEQSVTLPIEIKSL
jgi:hypothetical protein